MEVMFYKWGKTTFSLKTPFPWLRRIIHAKDKMKDKMQDIFEFNHIDKSLSKSDIETLKDFYRHYHKKYWCFKNCYKSYKFLDNVLTITGISLVTIGTIAGGITLNPVVLGVINGAGIIVAGIGKKENAQRKIEMSKIAYTTYEKVLVELRSALRGDEWDKQEFVDRMKLIDEMIIDQTPLSDRFVSNYNKKFMGGPQNPLSSQDKWKKQLFLQLIDEKNNLSTRGKTKK